MRRVVLALALALALALPGCAEEGGFSFSRGDTLPPDPYYKEYRELMAGEHHKDFPIPIEVPAKALVLTLALSTRDQGMPLPTIPATVQLRVLAPDGTVLEEADVGANRSEATVAIDGLDPGRYLARVDGFGASQDLDGKPVGSEYVLTIEALYE